MIEGKFCETIGCLNKAETRYEGFDLCGKCFYEYKALTDMERENFKRRSEK